MTRYPSPALLSLESVTPLSPVPQSRRSVKYLGAAKFSFKLNKASQILRTRRENDPAKMDCLQRRLRRRFPRRNFKNRRIFEKNDWKVFIYWLGTEPYLYMADPEFLKQVISGALDKKWGKPNVFKHDRKPMFGNGLIMSEGEEWTQHRHTIALAFSVANLNTMMGLIVESTTNMVNEWSNHFTSSNNQATVDIEKYITKNAAEIIAKVIFGLGQENSKLVFQKLKIMQSMLFKSNRLIGVPFSKMLHPRQSYNSWKLGKEIDDLLLSIISSRKEDTYNSNAARQQDLLSLLLAGNQECKTFFFGGYETTALGLTWTLFLLALYPEWQKILRDEFIEVSGGGPLDFTMLNGLTKMDQRVPTC